MSKALICDRCKKTISEQSAMHIDTKFMFIISHYDLCNDCRVAFEADFMKQYNRKENDDDR